MKTLRTTSFLLALAVAPTAHAAPTYTMQILGNYADATSTSYTAINDNGQMIGAAYFVTPLPYPLPSPVSTTIFRTEPYSSVTPGQDDILAPPNPTGNHLVLTGTNNLGQVVGNDYPNIFVTPADGSRQVALPLPDTNGVQGINDAGQILSSSTVYTPDGAGGYSARLIDPSGQFVPQGAAINNAGQVAGKFLTPGPLFRTAPNLPLNPATDLFSFGQLPNVTDINANGFVIGYASLPDPITGGDAASLHSFLFDGTIHDLGSFAGLNTVAYSINNAGQIVGGSVIPDPPTFNDHAFLYQDGHMYDLNDLTTSHGDWTIITANDVNNEGIILAQAELPGQYTPTSILLIPTPEPATTLLLTTTALPLLLKRRR